MPKQSLPKFSKRDEPLIRNIRFSRLNDVLKPRSRLSIIIYGFCALVSITFIFHCIIRLVASIVNQ